MWVRNNVDGTEGSERSGRGGRDGSEMVEEMPEDVFLFISEVTGWKIGDEMNGGGRGEEEKVIEMIENGREAVK